MGTLSGYGPGFVAKTWNKIGQLVLLIGLVLALLWLVRCRALGRLVGWPEYSHVLHGVWHLITTDPEVIGAPVQKYDPSFQPPI